MKAVVARRRRIGTLRRAHFPSRVATIPPEGKIPLHQILHAQVEELVGVSGQMAAPAGRDERQIRARHQGRLDAQVHVSVPGAVIVTDRQAVHGGEQPGKGAGIGRPHLGADGRGAVRREKRGNGGIGGRIEPDRLQVTKEGGVLFAASVTVVLVVLVIIAATAERQLRVVGVD